MGSEERLERAASKYGETLLDPLAFGTTLAMGILIVALPRRWALLPVILGAVFIPVAQRIVIVDVDFSMLRILMLFAFARLMVQGDFRWVKLHTYDKVFVAWVVAGALVYVVRGLSVGALINRLGYLFDGLGVYFFVRSILRSRADLQHAARFMEWSVIVLALLMSYEWGTGRNLLSIFGGVPEFTPIRHGKMRCQGAFNHPILAGTYAATVLPIALGDLLYSRAARTGVLVPLVAIVASIAATFLSVSSGPVIALMIGVVGWCAWIFRMRLRQIRYGIAFGLVALEIVTSNPIWHLVVYLNFIGGSTGYHRYRLIQAFVDHWREWWMFGTRSTLHWGHWLHDITNQYILEGIRGGIWSLGLFIAVISIGYQNVGRALAATRADPRLGRRSRRAQELLLFGFGVTLFVHTIGMLSVSYYGQMNALFTVLLATLGVFPQAFRIPRALLHQARRKERRTGAKPLSPVRPEA